MQRTRLLICVLAVVGLSGCATQLAARAVANLCQDQAADIVTYTGLINAELRNQWPGTSVTITCPE
jgi:outer membrane lipoprotein-sorting protein